METGDGATAEEAEAAPVASKAGTGGLGRTPEAVASPVLLTTSLAVNAWPRSMVVPPCDEASVSEPRGRRAGRCTGGGGGERERRVSRAGRCTAAVEGADVALSAAPELTSVAFRAAEKVS